MLFNLYIIQIRFICTFSMLWVPNWKHAVVLWTTYIVRKTINRSIKLITNFFGELFLISNIQNCDAFSKIKDRLLDVYKSSVQN